MCSCGSKTAATSAATQKWVVTFTDGSTVTKSTEVAARIAASKDRGATYAKA